MSDVSKIRVQSINPLIVTIDDFAEEAECEAAINAATGGLERAPVLGAGVSEVRTNTRAVIDHRQDGWLNGLCLKVSQQLRMPASHSEPINVLNYQPGEVFEPHSDGFDLFDHDAEAQMALGGQRLFTSILYLNDVAEGGATVFPALGLSVAAKKRRLLIFSNCWAGERGLCGHSVHTGTPVRSGEKWAATFWWRERPYPA